MTSSVSRTARLIAYYLPQFHPIPENNEWWGPGFTEWTNVAKARPLFPGHHQPNLPADLGFYDLRVPETRLAQAELARTHGIEGFCYWHYWFGNGKRILERPFAEVLQSGEPDFPFCLAWANQSWTGIWHGNPDYILVKQEYPGLTDYREHFFSILDTLTDDRYITVDGKPLFLVFRAHELPDARLFTDFWRELAHEVGLPGIHFCAIVSGKWNPIGHGFDSITPNGLLEAFRAAQCSSLGLIDDRIKQLTGKTVGSYIRRLLRYPKVISYKHAINLPSQRWPDNCLTYPSIMPNWDNTPRSGSNGFVFHNSTPARFQSHLHSAIQNVVNHEPKQRIIFIKSWNEWAEGNYLEPDLRFGRAYLEVIRDEILHSPLNPCPDVMTL